ncbi:hypothetical protein CDD82_6140 [Ophiocordyceps australis]|uniref:OTU domain-containing protein n=1 Tax=Ophiocordyceps australis TaxID=1399860 RepID=A0A2C5YXS6_9HYPO|nr:hypothetical protein CDD82_6140 [Ophiocordyceps australis]
MEARHKREMETLQTRVTSKKRNASKKTRKGVVQECERLERELRERQDEERAKRTGQAGGEDGEGGREEQDQEEDQEAGVDKRDGGKDGDKEREQAQEQVAAAVDKLRHAQDKLVTATQQMQLASQDGQSQGSAPAAKKRNRQRERLARRAAEQEAVASAAEHEASQMTNHRSVEAEAMQQAMAQHGLVEVQVPPDGHCLFSAVADQLHDKKIALSAASSPPLPPYKTLRRAAAEYMLAHADDFAPYLDDGDDLASYAARMRDTAEWGGHMELLALARTYDALICVLHDGRIERVGDGAQEQQRALWLAYYRHGFGLGAHYNSLRSKTA